MEIHAIIDGRLKSGTAQGQILFWDNTLKRWVYAETSELFWDDVNKKFVIGATVGLTVDSTTLVVDAVNHRVGIHAANPTVMLQLGGDDSDAGIIHFGDSNVNHGATNILPTNIGGQVRVKNNDGGLLLTGVTEDGDFSAFLFHGVIGAVTATVPAIEFDCRFKSGVGQAEMSETNMAVNFRTQNRSLLTIMGGGNIGISEIAPETLLEMTSTAPYLTLHNSTEENSDGGRESRINFKGEQDGTEETTLARIEVSHDGSEDDEKGKIVFSVNDGNDGNTPTDAVTIDSDGGVDIAGGLTVDTTTLVVDAVNHRVGIGEASPQRILHLKGDTPFIRLENTAEGGQTLEFFAGTGGVGIGTPTTSQQFVLDVDAPVNAMTIGANSVSIANLTFGLFTKQVFSNTGDDLFFKPGLGDDSSFLKMQAWTGSGYETLLSYKNTSGGGADLLLVENSGNVGIKETAPETLLEMTSTVPYLTLHNSTEENTDGGRESCINFKGEQDGTEETTLARIGVSHDGAADDEKGKLVISVNDGSDGDTPTDRFKIDADGTTHIGDGTNEIQISATGILSLAGTAGLQLPHMMQSDSTTQTVGTINEAQLVTFNTDVHHFGITRTSSSRFTILTEASYLIAISAVCDTAPGQSKDIEMWLRINGTDAANTNTILHLNATNEMILAVTYIIHFDVDDYFEFWMTGEGIDVNILATAAVTTEGFERPACPSIIMTCNYAGVD